jgi:hypothetical protein
MKRFIRRLTRPANLRSPLPDTLVRNTPSGVADTHTRETALAEPATPFDPNVLVNFCPHCGSSAQGNFVGGESVLVQTACTNCGAEWLIRTTLRPHSLRGTPKRRSKRK